MLGLLGKQKGVHNKILDGERILMKLVVCVAYVQGHEEIVKKAINSITDTVKEDVIIMAVRNDWISYGWALNKGVKVALDNDADFVCLNDDLELLPNWLD